MVFSFSPSAGATPFSDEVDPVGWPTPNLLQPRPTLSENPIVGRIQELSLPKIQEPPITSNPHEINLLYMKIEVTLKTEI